MSFLRGLARYTPLDRTIRSGMFKATLGFDPFSAESRAQAPLPIAGMRGGRFAGKGPLEMFGPRPDPLGTAARRETLARALSGNRARTQRPGIPTGLTAQARAKRGEPYNRQGEGPVYRLPANSKLFHSSYHGDSISKQGFRPSKDGESGPGVYLAPNDYVGKRYPERDLLDVRPNRELRLIDRTNPRGEKLFRQLQGHTNAERKSMPQRVKAAGYDGVYYQSGGKRDPEIVIHNPSVLKTKLARKAAKPKSTPTTLGKALAQERHHHR